MIAGFLLILATQCTESEKKTKSGHDRMIGMLDSIRQHADPLQYLHCNKGKAAIFKEKMQSAGGQELLKYKFSYASELLKAGQNEAAILQFSEFISIVGDQMTEQNKILYELLALSYMRLGEQNNCIDTHNPESCILPISGKGVYTMTAGPENAIVIYKRILDAFPDDYQTRWLYNLAFMTLGKWPEAVPKQYLLPEHIFMKRGNIHFKDVAIPLGLDVKGISGGVCLEDFDNDYDIDLFVTAYGLGDQARFFRNNGDGTFTERTREANLTGIFSGLNTVHADYNNDGFRDILILRGAWLVGGKHPNSLLRNNGDGTFTDVTIEAGLLSFHPTQAADWADYDGDGWLDLFIANETYNQNDPQYCELYHNNGDGTFSNVTIGCNLNYIGFFKAVVWGDVNNDQRPDLYVSNLFGDNLLLINRGGSSPENWRFEDIAPKTGTRFPETSFPAFFFDFDNDGRLDIFCSNFPPNYEDPSIAPLVQEYLGKRPAGDWIRLYRNNGDETFTDVADKTGLNTITYAMGNNFGDLDNDGWLDIFLGTGKPDLRSLIPNRVFHNQQGKKFEDISIGSFSHIQKGHAIAFADMDNDGDQDVYVVAGGAVEGDLGNNILYENPGNRNHWITLFLEGKTCNRDALGARIKITVRQPKGNLRDIYTTVNTGGSFGSSSLRQEIGLGDATDIVAIEVQWPKPGLPNAVFTKVPMNAAYKITEGETAVEPVPMKQASFLKM